MHLVGVCKARRWRCVKWMGRGVSWSVAGWDWIQIENHCLNFSSPNQSSIRRFHFVAGLDLPLNCGTAIKPCVSKAHLNAQACEENWGYSALCVFLSSTPFPAPPAFLLVDTKLKSFCTTGRVANSRHKGGGGRNLDWMALVCLGETPREALGVSLGETPEKLWSSGVCPAWGKLPSSHGRRWDTVGNETLNTGVVSRGGGLWSAKSRRGVWFGFVFKINTDFFCLLVDGVGFFLFVFFSHYSCFM